MRSLFDVPGKDLCRIKVPRKPQENFQITITKIQLTDEQLKRLLLRKDKKRITIGINCFMRNTQPAQGRTPPPSIIKNYSLFKRLST